MEYILDMNTWRSGEEGPTKLGQGDTQSTSLGVSDEATALDWNHLGYDGDIIAYRILGLAEGWSYE